MGKEYEQVFHRKEFKWLLNILISSLKIQWNTIFYLSCRHSSTAFCWQGYSGRGTLTLLVWEETSTDNLAIVAKIINHILWSSNSSSGKSTLLIFLQKCKETCVQGIFITVKYQNQPECSPLWRWLNKLWYIHTVKSYAMQKTKKPQKSKEKRKNKDTIR